MSFDKEKFAQLLTQAKGDRSINQYALHSGVSAAHISRLMRGLLTTPPNPDTIKLLAEKAHNEITYNELMRAAGHFEENAQDYNSPPWVSMNIFGERLKQLRENKELSQGELGKRFNLSQSTIAYYESNKKQPSQNTLNKMADFFDVSTDYLLGRIDKPNGKKSSEEAFKDFISDPELERWHRELPKTPEEDLRKLRKMWEIMQEDKD